jgi:hypothetical protein
MRTALNAVQLVMTRYLWYLQSRHLAVNRSIHRMKSSSSIHISCISNPLYCCFLRHQYRRGSSIGGPCQRTDNQSSSTMIVPPQIVPSNVYEASWLSYDTGILRAAYAEICRCRAERSSLALITPHLAILTFELAASKRPILHATSMQWHVLFSVVAIREPVRCVVTTCCPARLQP